MNGGSLAPGMQPQRAAADQAELHWKEF